MAWYEYMRLKLADMPEDVIEHYHLHDIAMPDGYVYCKICQGMYGLPQAGIFAQELLPYNPGHKNHRGIRTTH
jgi:hypothetical protein